MMRQGPRPVCDDGAKRSKEQPTGGGVLLPKRPVTVLHGIAKPRRRPVTLTVDGTFRPTASAVMRDAVERLVNGSGSHDPNTTVYAIPI
jgi:hypothetical protein